jgi:hypothetical protein
LSAWEIYLPALEEPWSTQAICPLAAEEGLLAWANFDPLPEAGLSGTEMVASAPAKELMLQTTIATCFQAALPIVIILIEITSFILQNLHSVC